MKLSLDLRTSLSQTLTPQQIQYLKLLQLPLLQLEQQVIQELEQNPMLEEFGFEDSLHYDDNDIVTSQEIPDLRDRVSNSDYEEDFIPNESDYVPKSPIDDTGDPFEFYKLVWQDDADTPTKHRTDNDDDHDYFQMKDSSSLYDEILEQLRMSSLNKEALLFAEQVVGNVDDDGYLRRPLNEIIEETNILIENLNYEISIRLEEDEIDSEFEMEFDNPARDFALSSYQSSMLHPVTNSINNFKNNGFIKDNLLDYNLNNHITEITQNITPEIPSKILFNKNGKSKGLHYLDKISPEQGLEILRKIQSLDPPGFASRDIRECLLAQCNALPKKNAAQKLAREILEYCYDAFTMKHYHVIMKQLEVNEEYLKEAFDVIKRLNPKPGSDDSSIATNTVIPDFIIERNQESNELMITVNDSRIPVLKVNQAYEKIKKDSRQKTYNKDTRDWIRNKYEDAKFLIQALRQRKSTMLKVMTAIAALQSEFFYKGHSALKPLIYKDVAEDTGLDISTVCRIVNNKYVQTEFGTYELKFFFSESLPNEDGEEVSTRVIKQIIKDIIETETKDKPYSDDKIEKELKNKGYQIARRTVAKYREQLRIPVARLRKEL